MTIDWRDYISSDPMICNGKVCITGTRVTVTVILDSLANGLTVEAIVSSYLSVSREGCGHRFTTLRIWHESAWRRWGGSQTVRFKLDENLPSELAHCCLRKRDMMR